MTKYREKYSKNKPSTEINAEFLLNQLEEYHQKWLNKLIQNKAEYLHKETIVLEGLIVFTYTYNVYYKETIYQVTATHDDLLCVRKLYSQIHKKQDGIITYKQVNENQIVTDPQIIISLRSILNEN